MKNLLFLLFIFFCQFVTSQSGGSTCSQMQPICTDAGVQFTANSGIDDAEVSDPGNDYGCLASQPNPNWYYIEVATAGDIIMELSASDDVDFIIWGPFNNLSAAQAACGSYSNILDDTGCNFVFGIPTGCDAYGCSFDPSNVETPGIPNAQVGQVYVMLITNFADVVQDITLTQTGGTGATDCSIVTPTVCSITNLVANIGACNSATGNYTISGTISYTNPPSTGNLVVEDCNGTVHTVASAASLSASGSVNYSYTLPANGSECDVTAYFTEDEPCANGPINYTAPTCPTTTCFISNLEANIGACNTDNSFTVDGIFSYQDNPGTGSVVVTVTNGSGSETQTFNAPFVDGQDYTYSVTMNSDGTPLTVTVSFSADPGCSLTLNSTSPANCTCAAQIGTFTVTTDGNQSVNNIGLCFGDILDISANGDWTQPEEATDPPADEGYDPDIIWLVYSCPPTVAVFPNTTSFITDDPCLITLINSPDLPEVNDMFWIDNLPPGTFTNNTVYFVPITAYNVSVNPLLVSYTNTDLPCYQMGPVYAVQYIPEVTFTQEQDCPTGTVAATVSGGLPSVDGSQFTAVAGSLTPTTANFVTTTASNNGTITVGGLNNGDNYSFSIEDGNGCGITVTGTFVGGNATSISFPQPSYCEDEPNPTPTVTGTSGGTFSSGSGLVINSSTGNVNLLGSNPGTYTVTYTPPAGTCEAPSTCTITIHGLPPVNAGTNISICQGQSAILTASGADQYTWDNGIQNGTSFTPSLGTTVYTVTGTSSAGCTNTDQVSVTVTPLPTASFIPDTTMGCIPLNVTFTNTSVGSANCIWNFGDGSIATGCSSVTNTYTEEGCFDVTLTITSASGCQASISTPSLICVEEAPEAYFIPSPNVLTEFDNIIFFDNESTGAISYTWNFGDNSELSNAENPSHEYPTAEQGDGWSIQLIAQSPMGCLDTAYATIYFQEELIFYVPNTFTPDDDDYNQTFQPIFTSGFDPYDFTMWIFNRWGELVFETRDATKGWDGSYGSNGQVELVQDGTYTWKIEFKTLKNDERKWYVGHVNIVR
jgi:gliding motility-associated-like protein